MKHHIKTKCNCYLGILWVNKTRLAAAVGAWGVFCEGRLLGAVTSSDLICTDPFQAFTLILDFVLDELKHSRMIKREIATRYQFPIAC